jgi:hypothetical protein
MVAGRSRSASNSTPDLADRNLNDLAVRWHTGEAAAIQQVSPLPWTYSCVHAGKASWRSGDRSRQATIPALSIVRTTNRRRRRA